MALRRDELGAAYSSDCRLVTALSNVVESVPSQNWELPAKYALVFGATTAPGYLILLVDEEGIIRFIAAESMDRVWQLVSGDFILRPVQSPTPTGPS